MESNQPTNKVSNYRSWSFRFLIYLFLLNILVAYIVATTISTSIKLEGYETPTNNSGLILSILVIVSNILLITGIITTILSIIKKEEKDFKYYVSIIGYLFFLLIGVFSII